MTCHVERLSRSQLFDVIRSSVRLLTREDLFVMRRNQAKQATPKSIQDKLDEYYRDDPQRKPSLVELSINAMAREEDES